MLHRAMWHEGELGIHPLRQLYIQFLSADNNTFIVWDGYNSLKRRRDIYPGYKQRPEKAEDIKASFDILKEVLCHCHVTQVEIPTWEADDVIYTLALDYARSFEVKIETNDQDFWQLADEPNIQLPMVKPLPCQPTATCAYKALVGDQSDSIPGWRGFGPARFAAVEDELATIKHCLKNKDWDEWQTIQWPKGIKLDQETFFQCCIYYEVVKMQTVPEEEFANNFICGKYEPALAEEIFARWRI